MWCNFSSNRGVTRRHIRYETCNGFLADGVVLTKHVLLLGASWQDAGIEGNMSSSRDRDTVYSILCWRPRQLRPGFACEYWLGKPLRLPRCLQLIFLGWNDSRLHRHFFERGGPRLLCITWSSPLGVCWLEWISCVQSPGNRLYKRCLWWIGSDAGLANSLRCSSWLHTYWIVSR